MQIETSTAKAQRRQEIAKEEEEEKKKRRRVHPDTPPFSVQVDG
jgi:hypothetical protein